MTENIVEFSGGAIGQWRVTKMDTVRGQGLEQASHIKITQLTEDYSPDKSAAWNLYGCTSNFRYTEQVEKEQLKAIEPELGRSFATHGALIPIRKSAAWWVLAQDKRRVIFESQSNHIKTDLRYLPAIARKLYHSRDSGCHYDFLTWFEFAPTESNSFEELVTTLRKSPEWDFVEEEVDIRVVRIQ